MKTEVTAVTRFFSALLALSALLSAPAAWAQESQNQRANHLPAPVRAPGAAFDVSVIPVSPGDAELGKQSILAGPPDAPVLSAQFGVAYFFTDNAALHSDDTREDWIFSPQARLSYTPSLAADLSGEMTVRYQMYRFDEESFLDFESLNAGAGLIRALPSLGGVSVFGRYNYERLADGGSLLFDTHSLQAGLFQSWAIAERHEIHASAYSDFSLQASPDRLRHHTHEAMLGWLWRPLDRFSVETYYRFEYEDYTRNSRHDHSHTLGAAARVEITPWLALTPLVSWTSHKSSRSGSDYDVLNAGAYLMLHANF